MSTVWHIGKGGMLERSVECAVRAGGEQKTPLKLGRGRRLINGGLEIFMV